MKSLQKVCELRGYQILQQFDQNSKKWTIKLVKENELITTGKGDTPELAVISLKKATLEKEIGKLESIREVVNELKDKNEITEELTGDCQHIIGMYTEYDSEPVTVSRLKKNIQDHILNVEDEKQVVLNHFEKMFKKYEFCPKCGEKIEFDGEKFFEKEYDDYVNSDEYNEAVEGILDKYSR